MESGGVVSLMPVLDQEISEKESELANMIHSIQIHGYRGFQRYEIDGLERVNLLVGMNNSGKTSILEAIYLLISRGEPFSLWNVLWRRGERLPPLPERGAEDSEIDISHLFNGHDLHFGIKVHLDCQESNTRAKGNISRK